MTGRSICPPSEIETCLIDFDWRSQGRLCSLIASCKSANSTELIIDYLLNNVPLDLKVGDLDTTQGNVIVEECVRNNN